MSKAHLTAIARKSLSQPTKYLIKQGLIVGKTLDYGCGKGYDCDELGCDGYDPYHRPGKIKGKYDTIYCNFVLNVIADPLERDAVIASILKLLKAKGTAYISVRNDRRALNGYTSRGTWQGLIQLPLPVVKSTTGWTMYKLIKKDWK